MAVELIGYADINEQMAIQEAASAGLKSMEHLIRTVSHQNQQLDCREMTDFTVSKFRKVISMLNRTGHARFRRRPVQPQPQPPAALAPAQNHPRPQDSVSPVYKPQPLNLFSLSSTPAASHTPAAVQPLTLDFTKPSAGFKKEIQVKSKEGFSLSTAVSTSGTSSSTFVSSITGEGSVSNGKGGSPSMFLTPAQAISTGRPPLSSKMCRDHDHSDNISGKPSGSSRCHCKKKKSKVKRTIRVPAISSKVADIPSDEYSWRKYGQKPIKGSPYPRGYYKCSAVKMCPARKHVERATDDPKMLIVTYEGDHRHNTRDTAMQEIQNGGACAPTQQLVVFESS